MIRSDRLFTPVAVVVLTILIGACSSAATPSPTVAPTPTPTAAPTQAPPSAEASATAAAGEPSALPSDLGSLGALMHGDPALEAALPSEIGGNQLQKFSFKGDSSLLGAAGQSQQLNDLQGALGQLGKSMSDLGFAVAGSDAVTIGAYQISGLDANAVWGAMQNAFSQANASAQISDASFAGKAVKKIVSSDSNTAYLYPHGDILFFVTANTDALLNEAFSKLP